MVTEQYNVMIFDIDLVKSYLLEEDLKGARNDHCMMFF